MLHVFQRFSIKVPSFPRSTKLFSVNHNLLPLITIHRFLSTNVDLKNLTPIDIEKELFKLKRRMGGYYSKGLYVNALECATELEEKVSSVMGAKNAVYASCLNNIALMNKILGNTDVAMSKYTEALHLYEELLGKKHASYVSTLANIGTSLNNKSSLIKTEKC